MADAKCIPTLMVNVCKLTKYGGDSVADRSLYRSIVVALQYANITCQEISHSVHNVCQFLCQPLEKNWKVIKRIPRYLKGTVSFGLLLHPANATLPLSIQAFCDADWALDPGDRRSTSGSCIYLGPILISWWSKRQQLVVRSSTEAEYRSLTTLPQKLFRFRHCSRRSM